MIKRSILVFVLAAVFSSLAWAFDPTLGAAIISQQDIGSKKMQSSLGMMSISFIKAGSSEVPALSWYPDFRFGPWGLGADINIALGDKRPDNLEGIVVRYAEYDDLKKGLRFGVLDNITYGHGLIMSGYSTRKGSQILLNNEQTGLKGYYDFDRGAVKALATRSNIYSVRIEERINPMLTLGEYYILDSTGRSIIQPNGLPKQFQPVSAIGIDAAVPLPANFEGYAEAGQLMNYGTGVNAGISWAYDAMVANANFSAEYRFLEKGFIPSYFNVDYESNPADLSSAEATGKAKNGYLVKLGVNALGMASLTAAYESYVESNSSLSADLFAKPNEQVSFRGYYKQPNFVDFRSVSLENGAIMGADITYKLNPLTSLIAHVKKAYNPTTGQVETTQYYEIGLNI